MNLHHRRNLRPSRRSPRGRSRPGHATPSAALLGLALALALAAAPAATAATWTEVGDAGTLPSNAQVAFGDGGLTSISGSLNSTTDRDMFEIYIDGGGTFSATTVAQPGTVFDTQLFLFDSSGMGVYASDDDPSAAGASQFRSTLPASNPLTPVASGYYFLLIDNSPSFPTGAGGVIFPNFATSAAAEFAVVGPTGPGGGSPITGYSGSGTETGTYTIALTGASFIIPEPGTLALLAAGSPVLLALALRRRGRSGRRPSPAATSPRD